MNPETNCIEYKQQLTDDLEKEAIAFLNYPGVPRILRSYGKECFRFTENFLRMTFPASAQVKELVGILEKEMDRQEIQNRKPKDRQN